MNASPHLSQPQISHSTIPPSQQYQSHMDHQTLSIPQNAYHSPQVSTQPMTEFPQLDSGLAVLVFTQGDDPIACLNKAMAFLSAVAASRFPSTNNQLRTSSNPRNQATIQDGRVTVQQVQGRQGQSYVGHMARESGQILDEEQLAFLADPCIPDEVLKPIFPTMVSDVILEEKANQEKNNESLTAELERYKERVKTFEHRLNIDLSTRKKMIDSQMDDMIKEKLALKQQIDSLEQNLSNQIKEKESLLQTFTPQVFYDDTHKQALGYQNSFYLKKAQQIKPTLYDGSVISSQHAVIPMIDDEETLILEETLKDIFNVFDKDLLNEVTEVQTVFKQMEAVVQQCSVDKQYVMLCVMNSTAVFDDSVNLEMQSSESYDKCSDLDAELLKKQNAYNELLKILKNNRDAHEDYLKKTIENTDTIRGLVERTRKQNPSEPLSACMFTKHVQELLVYVSQTCPSLIKPSERLVVVTPMNKVKKVRFSEPLTSSSNIHKQVESSKTPYSNTHVLPSTGLKSFTSISRSQPKGNTKNDRISYTPSSNMKNKVEAQLRRVNLNSNKKNHVEDPICDTNVKHTMLNANFELICFKCKQCMFDTNHDVCFIDFVNDVNVRSKSKTAKQSQQYNIWKPTGKVFTEIGYKWKPTGKRFTLIGNPFPLTRFTSTKVVPLKETTSHSVETHKPEIKVYSRRPKQVKSIGTIRFGNDQIAKIIGYGDYQLGKVTISRVYYVEGLGHNLFSVGQFCNSDLEVAF
ncbi:hypothetical protein Tco_0281436 [Tanacetum coccineum]